MVALVAGVVILGPSAEPAHGQGENDPVLQTIQVWTEHGGQVADPKVWKYRMSVAGDDLGSASAAAPDLDDSAWATAEPALQYWPDSDVANHFRKDFDLADLDIELHQVISMQVELHYDDAAVLYLNGHEVYRTIRGNLDPTYELYPEGTDIPHDAIVTGSGYENEYTKIPDTNLVNTCENNPTCTNSPYGSPHPPAVPIDLLVDGTNTWGVTIWDNAGGNADIRFDHLFSITYDDAALPLPQVFINEAMASNDTTVEIDLDDDGDLDTPDWIELHNIDQDNDHDIGGWTIGDRSAEWTFPANTTVPAGGYLLVYANDRDIGNPPQTNFKLSSGGESLKLITSWGTVANEYTMGEQLTDISFGRVDDTGEPTYLQTATPGTANSVSAITQAAPILRHFRDRMYNAGEIVDLGITAFDIDGDELSYSISPRPAGTEIDADTGVITGTFDDTRAELASTITVTDSDGESASQAFTWIRVDDPVGDSTPIALNEYNAVPADEALLGGSELGNGGDWFEFVVIEDDLDLRGWIIEFRQRDADTDALRIQTVLQFADRPELGRLPAGTILTISEEQADNLSFDGDTDWSINLGVDEAGNGEFFEPGIPGVRFNSTRRDQTVLIRNADGEVVSPLAGETEGWDAAKGGVNDHEVMNLCLDIAPGAVIDPIADYEDNSTLSTFGAPNTCYLPDPNDDQQTIADEQDLSALRGSAKFGRGSGDANCDLQTTIADALMIARSLVGFYHDDGLCLLDGGGAGHEFSEVAGDFDGDGRTTIGDALFIAQCEARLPTPYCPDP